MSLESFIARRFFHSQKKSGLVLFLAFVALFGTTLSVFSILSIHAVMNGFSHHLREAIIGFKAPLVIKNITDDEHLASLKHFIDEQKEVKIIQVSEVLEFDGILETPDGDTGGARFRGGLPLKDDRLELDLFEPYTKEDLSRGTENGWVILGEDLFSRLNLFPDAGGDIKITYPFGAIGPTGEMEPKQKILTVWGTFKSGYYDFDTQYAIMSESDLSSFISGSSMAATLAVQLDPGDADLFKNMLLKKFPSEKIATWTEDNQKLFSALKLEKMGMILLLTLVVIVAAFNTVGLVGLFSVRKLADLSVLYAMGLTRSQMKRVFSVFSLTLGFIGTALGILMAFVFLSFIKTHPVVLPSAYAVQTLPVLMDARLFILVFFTGPLITWMAGRLPLQLVSRFNPLEVLLKSQQF